MNRFSIFLALIFGLLTVAASATTATFRYVAGAYETNFAYQLQPGETLKFTQPVPEGLELSRLEFKPQYASIPRTTINVGLNKFKNNREKALGGCVLDAKHMSELLSCSQSKNVVLTDDEATKEKVRGEIAAAASSLSNGCEFVFSISTHGGDNPPCVCLYDGDYAAEELAEDLALFQDGVKVAMVFDCCHAAASIPEFKFAEAALSALRRLKLAKKGAAFSNVDPAEDVVFLVATSEKQLSGDLNSLGGVFSNSLYHYGRGMLADANGDGVITFKELYEVSCMVQTVFGTIKNQTPIITNTGLAEEFIATPVQDQDSIGELSIDSENSAFTYSIVAPPFDFQVFIGAEEPDSGKNIMELTYFRVNLKPGAPNYDYAGKTKMAFAIGDSSADLYKLDMTGFLCMNNFRYAPPVIANVAKFKNSKEKCDIVGSDWESRIGKCQISGNPRKNLTALKLSSKDAFNGAPAIKLESGLQHIDFFTRVNGRIINCHSAIKVLYDPVKGLKARLAKSAPPKSQAE